jgi:hypothetical protein
MSGNDAIERDAQAVVMACVLERCEYVILRG